MWLNRSGIGACPRFWRRAKSWKDEWLGRRDSNPDTQIQSSLQPQAAQQDQGLNPAKSGEVRQNPQYRRNNNGLDTADNRAMAAEKGSPEWDADALRRLDLVDFEEDSLS
jgi:hypothetical protein